MAFVDALGRLVGKAEEVDLSALPVWMDPIELSQVRAVVEVLAPRRVLEWGAGGSTRELLATCPFIERYVSVEHNREWHGRVAAVVGDPRLDLHLVEPAEPEPTGGRTRQSREAVTAWRLRAETELALMRAYVELPRTLADPEFDFVLVDGRARSLCVREGFSLLRPGGVLIVHDAQRAEYHQALREVGKPVFLEPWKQGQVCLVRKPDRVHAASASV